MSIRILVIGSGSIGRRHIANLLAIGADVTVFSYRGNISSFPEGVKVLNDLNEVLVNTFEGVVVANRTDLHVDTALRFGRLGMALFIEKPLSNNLSKIAELQEVVREMDIVVETGFMLRFHPNLLWIRDFLTSGKLGKVHYMRIAVGQYLPEWRAGTDHRICYSAKREFGGGVIFDLVHDLDIAQWMAGGVDEAAVMVAYEKSLEVETEALAQMSLRCANGVLAQVHMDYLRPTYARTMEIVGSQGALLWNYTAGRVELDRPSSGITLVHEVPMPFERNDMFVAHMKLFLQRIRDRRLAAASSLEDGVAALRVAMACHASAEKRQFVRLAEVEPTYCVKSFKL